MRTRTRDAMPKPAARHRLRPRCAAVWRWCQGVKEPSRRAAPRPRRRRNPVAAGLWSALAGLLAPAMAGAAGASLDAIEAEAERWIRAEARDAHPRATRIETRVRRLDRRLALAECGQALEAFLPPGGRRLGRTAVGVRCPAPRPWQLYVQVEVRAFAPVLVAARALDRGVVLESDDVRAAVHDLSGLRRPAAVQPAEAVGRELRRHVRRGEVLHTGLLGAPRVIRRGQRVSIRSGAGAVRVRMGGEALEAGAVGDLVRVRNRSSGQVVEARIVGPGRVRVER